jgi:hypothetical protein
MSAREQWEEVSFQVFEDESGAIRSGYYPTGEGLVSGNIAVDFVYGKTPLQPNDDRSVYQTLSVGNDHKLSAVEWDSYPTTSKIAANYMVTAAVGDGSEITYTSQNNLIVGDTVTVSGLSAPSYNLVAATVTYADAYKFKIADSAEYGLVTGQRARVDVISDTRGATLEGGDAFYWPELWFCSSTERQSRTLSNVINELVSYGVPREYFVDFTFSGGENQWDSNGTPNYDGAILYAYIPADTIVFTDWLGQPIYGSAFDNVVVGANRNGNYEDYVDSGYPEDYMLLVLSNDPRKNNAGWWF